MSALSLQSRKLRGVLAWILALGALPVISMAAPVQAKRNITFLVTSDAHYDAFENQDRNLRVRETLRYMNAVTNLSWPESLGGGAIQKPWGVAMLGDCIDDGDRLFQGRRQTPQQWAYFVADFGLDGRDGLLKFPVFETWGNHDGPPEGQEKFGFSFQAHLKERNRLRQQKGWLAELSTNALHYSWDWEDVHFVQLGIYPADRPDSQSRYSPVWHDPQGALTFLKNDLAREVGPSGRPVVLMSHCGFDTPWWHTNDWWAAYRVFSQYNVVLYFYGHTGTGLSAWPRGENVRPITCVNTGQTENGFFVVQISGDKVRLAYRSKHWLAEETLPKNRTWDGTWDWRFPLEKGVAAGL